MGVLGLLWQQRPDGSGRSLSVRTPVDLDISCPVCRDPDRINGAGFANVQTAAGVRVYPETGPALATLRTQQASSPDSGGMRNQSRTPTLQLASGVALLANCNIL